jgi:hypothetical protein
MARNVDNHTITPEEKLAELARSQGAEPVDFEALIANAPGGPEDETADDMIAAIYAWRRQGPDRSLP